MTFLAPWALGAGIVGALGMVLLHLVAWQRPAAYLLPTARFIPDQRTVVARAATRPRDLLLLILRVLTLLAAAAAFARPVIAPAHGSVAHIILADRSRSVADSAEVSRRVAEATTAGARTVVLPFDTSLSAGLVMAHREARQLSRDVDSVALTIISPLTRHEVDSAAAWLRAQWPGALDVQRVRARIDSTVPWRLERPLGSEDVLGPATRALPATATMTVRLARGVLTANDSAFARNGGTVVRWDTEATGKASPIGVAAGEDVVVAAFARRAIGGGDAVAYWSDGEPAATQTQVGAGCIRDVGIAVPLAGDLALHAPFQRVVRKLLTPCGVSSGDAQLDSAQTRAILKPRKGAVPSSALRSADAPPTPLVKWLLSVAIALALVELLVRARMRTERAS